MELDYRKKKILTVFGVIVVIALYLMIFFFSSENGEQSSTVSRFAVTLIKKTYYFIAGGRKPVVVVDYTDTIPWEAIVRKLAHFTEYFLVGFASLGVYSLWIKRKQTCLLIGTVQIFLSGIFDEVHQSFIPGRNAAFKDVLIDTAGGMAGAFFMLLVILLIIKRNKRKKNP